MPEAVNWSRRACAPKAPKTTPKARRTAPVKLQFIVSMSHRVDQVVHTDAQSEGRKILRVLRIVGMLPGIAEIHVVADGDHPAAAIVINAAPVRLFAGLALLVGPAGFEIQGAGNLVLV